MRKSDWLRSRQQLEGLFDIYDQLPPQPPELKAHWIRYLVVRTSGFIETSISDFYSQYAEGKAAPRIIRFVGQRLEYPGNMVMDRILALAKEFGDDWPQEIVQHPDYDRIKAAVNSVVSVRNAIAHGQSTSTGITQLRDYYSAVIVLLELLFQQCDRDTHTSHWSRRERRALARN